MATAALFPMTGAEGPLHTGFGWGFWPPLHGEGKTGQNTPRGCRKSLWDNEMRSYGVSLCGASTYASVGARGRQNPPAPVPGRGPGPRPRGLPARTPIGTAKVLLPEGADPPAGAAGRLDRLRDDPHGPRADAAEGERLARARAVRRGSVHGGRSGLASRRSIKPNRAGATLAGRRARRARAGRARRHPGGSFRGDPHPAALLMAVHPNAHPRAKERRPPALVETPGYAVTLCYRTAWNWRPRPDSNRRPAV